MTHMWLGNTECELRDLLCSTETISQAISIKSNKVLKNIWIEIISSYWNFFCCCIFGEWKRNVNHHYFVPATKSNSLCARLMIYIGGWEDKWTFGGCVHCLWWFYNLNGSFGCLSADFWGRFWLRFSRIYKFLVW